MIYMNQDYGISSRKDEIRIMCNKVYDKATINFLTISNIVGDE
jgi:hypothetical protein